MPQFIKRPAFAGFETSYDAANYVVFGFPMDDSASYRPGSRNMPAAVREASLNIETNSLFTENDMADVLLHDLGDLVVKIGDHDDQIQTTQKLIQSIRAADKIPVMIGGEHSITEAAVEEFSESLFIIFDAHADLRTEYLGNEDSHACISYKIIEELAPAQLVQLGIRGISLEEKEIANKRGITQFTSLQIKQTPLQQILQCVNEKAAEYGSIYLSFDMDAYDPAFAPGVGTPEPLGLSPFEVFSILHGIKGNIQGIDINEMTPQLDPSGITSVLAAKTLQEILLR